MIHPTHTLFKSEDFGCFNGESKLAYMVKSGLNVCAKCGEYEAGLAEPCRIEKALQKTRLNMRFGKFAK